MTEQTPQEEILEFPVQMPGGMNAWDQADSLLFRSHTVIRRLPQATVDMGGGKNIGGWQQVAPAESPSMTNIDFFEDGWGTRLGSTLADDLRSVMVASDTLLDAFEWDDPASGTRIILVLGAKTIYTNQSGSFVQMKHNNVGGTAFTFGTDITKWTWLVGDSQLFIFTDGAKNRIRVYQNGDALNDALGNSTTTTTVDQDSTTDKTLYVASTTPFQPGDRVAVNKGGAREEFGYVASITAGDHLTMMDNLTYAHTAVQADVVKTYNVYVEAFDTSTTNIVTGDWSLGQYMGTYTTGRLCMSNGGLIEYTPDARELGSGIWDLAGASGGVYFARARIVAMADFVPDSGDINRSLLHVFTAHGPGILTGFEDYDQVMDQNRVVGGVPLNHRCVVAGRNFLYYLTENLDIEGVNGPNWVNIGRRLKNRSKTAILDTVDVTDSRLTAFGFYDRENWRLHFGATTASGRVNDLQLIVDMRLGEPQPGEQPASIEQKVRVHAWAIADPDSNPWFYGMFQILGDVMGVTKDGFTWTVGGVGLPRADMDAIGILDSWQSLWFNGGTGLLVHSFLNLLQRFKRSGGWSVNVDILLNYGSNAAKTVTVLQTVNGAALYDSALYDQAVYNAPGVVLKFNEISRTEQAISFRISNSTLNHYWRVLQQNFAYSPGAIIAQ